MKSASSEEVTETQAELRKRTDMATRPETPASPQQPTTTARRRRILTLNGPFCSILLRPQSVGDAIDIFHGNFSDLFLSQPTRLSSRIVNLFNASRGIDRITLLDVIGQNKALEAVGGDAYLTELIAAVPISTNIDHYAEIVLEKAMRRRLIDVCATVTAQTYQQAEEISELLTVQRRKYSRSMNGGRRIAFTPSLNWLRMVSSAFGTRLLPGKA